MAEITETQETEKTFTQEELNSIINQKIAEERKKADAYREKAEKFDEMEEANKTELQKAQDKAAELEKKLKEKEDAEAIQAIREKVSQDTGVPVSLLTEVTEELCKNQAKAILEFSKSNSYPALKDGGEPQHTGKKTTKQQFAEWAEQAFNKS